MKKQLSFSFLLVLFALCFAFLTSTFLGSEPIYQLKLLNLEAYHNQMVLYPTLISFKPHQISDFKKHFQKSQYNFYLYLVPSFFQVEDEIVWLKLT